MRTGVEMLPAHNASATTVTIQKSVMFLGEDPSNPEILAALAVSLSTVRRK